MVNQRVKIADLFSDHPPSAITFDTPHHHAILCSRIANREYAMNLKPQDVLFLLLYLPNQR